MAVVVKQKLSKNVKDDIEQLSGMFNSLLGGGGADFQVLAPKYNDAVATLKGYHAIMKLYLCLDSTAQLRVAHPECDGWFADMEVFMKEIADGFDLNDVVSEKEYWEAVMSENVAAIKKVTEALEKKYKRMKESDVIKKITATSSELKGHAKCLAGVYSPPADKMSDFSRFHPKFKREIERCDEWDFVGEMNTSACFKPLYFAPEMDFRYLWMVMDEKFRRYNVNFLSHLYFKGCQLYDIVTSPDVDMDKMSELLVDALCAFKDKIKGCGEAFKVLEGTVDILKRNFSQYFRNSVAKGQEKVFFEDFFMDVANQKGLDGAVIKSQFKKMGAEINKLIGAHEGLRNRPEIGVLCDLMNRNLDL